MWTGHTVNALQFPFSVDFFIRTAAFRGMRVRLRLAKYNLTPVASISVNGEHFRRPILVILKIPKMEIGVCEEVSSGKYARPPP